MLYRIPPDEVGWRFSSWDIARILAFEILQEKEAFHKQRDAERDAEAKRQRNIARR